MAWNVTLSERVRFYLDDSNTTDYSLERLAKFIAIAATEVFGDVGVRQNYEVNTSIPSISPDPETDPVSYLLVLKAVEIIIRNEYKVMGLRAGWRINDDRSSIDGSEVLKTLKDLLDKARKAYEDAKVVYQRDNGFNGMAVTSIYTGPFGSPSSYR